ncbi:hypothetical protein V1L54_27340 [Streptomyces sp. TRM 70361]|uniref:hypothetical protein n=1 Tax=Streptomyces sp. TRM 70361 TaxID=3116553 RepID=UPI002E7AD941|nr:hypothetical protein [Streptomyces sp. TRM 70361]MEE1943076.1 hypothetical protein [Streptomyces sp. TRM 70361]
MGRKREFKGTAAQQAMARFLVDVAESIGLDTTAKVAERFPRAASRSTWAEYLNGAKLIPRTCWDRSSWKYAAGARSTGARG